MYTWDDNIASDVTQLFTPRLWKPSHDSLRLQIRYRYLSLCILDSMCIPSQFNLKFISMQCLVEVLAKLFYTNLFMINTLFKIYTYGSSIIQHLCYISNTTQYYLINNFLLLVLTIKNYN